MGITSVLLTCRMAVSKILNIPTLEQLTSGRGVNSSDSYMRDFKK